MRAVAWQSPRKVSVETVPDPAYETFQKKEDGMVKVVLTP